MPTWSEIAGFLTYFGFTRESLPPLLAVGIGLYLVISSKISKVGERVEDIEKCIVEMQGILRNKYQLQFQRGVAQKYGQANSPIVLKDEFRSLIAESGLDVQVAAKKAQLVAWLQNEQPATGLDAQDSITVLVLSNQIEDYLDLTKFKQYLYEHGKTSEDAAGILTVYLFEVLIPELKLPELNEA